MVPGSSGTGSASSCVTDDSTHTGSVTAQSYPPYFSSDLCAIASAACCAAGQFSDGASCRPCGAGKYQPSSTNLAPGVIGACLTCPSGTYQNIEGQAECIKCEAGMLSNPTRTACGACLAGEYTKGSECASCPEGTFAPSAQEFTCINCAAGSSTNLVTRATSCSPW